MEESFRSLIEDWTGIAVLIKHDAATGSWIFIALHDDTLGPPVGGTRLKTYASPADGLLDAMRLAEGMTRKWAALGFDSGGGKGVLATPGPIEGQAREDLLRVYARLINTLRGGFATGRDLGTTDRDIVVLDAVTEHVHGVDREKGSVRDPGPYTAAGVFAAMQATLSRLQGPGDFAGRRVVLQGVGAVGCPLARLLVEAGAQVLLSDIDPERAQRLATELGAEAIPADAVYSTECDIYAPCAIGATLNPSTIPRLRCQAVVGSANNQLADDADAGRLKDREILYAPDFVANGGGALAFGLIHRGMKDGAEIQRRLRGIADTLTTIYTQADARGISPLEAANDQVAKVLSGGGVGS
jgi:leucine dehydrogenase